MGIGGGVSDPVSSDYEWVVTGDASTPIFCKFSLFSSGKSKTFHKEIQNISPRKMMIIINDDCIVHESVRPSVP